MKQLSNYKKILSGLKDKIRQAKSKAAFSVNAQLLHLYWEIGNTILKQQKQEGWGTKVITRLALDLKKEFPDMKGISERNLIYMQTFASVYSHFPFTQAPLARFRREPCARIRSATAVACRAWSRSRTCARLRVRTR